MDEKQVRAEYMRRFNLMLAMSAALAVGVLFPVSFIHPRQGEGPLFTWLEGSAIVACFFLALAILNVIVRRKATLFSADDKREPGSFWGNLGITFLSTGFGAVVLPKLLSGKPIHWLSLGEAFLLIFIIMVPPWKWFWTWKQSVLAALPDDSSLIKQSNAQ